MHRINQFTMEVVRLRGDRGLYICKNVHFVQLKRIKLFTIVPIKNRRVKKKGRKIQNDTRSWCIVKKEKKN